MLTLEAHSAIMHVTTQSIPRVQFGKHYPLHHQLSSPADGDRRAILKSARMQELRAYLVVKTRSYGY